MEPLLIFGRTTGCQIFHLLWIFQVTYLRYGSQHINVFMSNWDTHIMNTSFPSNISSTILSIAFSIFLCPDCLVWPAKNCNIIRLNLDILSVSYSFIKTKIFAELIFIPSLWKIIWKFEVASKIKKNYLVLQLSGFCRSRALWVKKM